MAGPSAPPSRTNEAASSLGGAGRGQRTLYTPPSRWVELPISTTSTGSLSPCEAWFTVEHARFIGGTSD